MRPRRRLPVFAMNLAYSRRRRTCLSATKFAGSCRATAISTHQKTQCVFVTDDDASRGFSFAPAGDRLAGGFERLRETQTPDNPLTAAEQLAETLVSHFGIADAVTIDADTDVESSRLTVSVQNAAFGPSTRPDHPVVSALACEIVRTTDSSVVVDPINDTTVALETDSALEE